MENNLQNNIEANYNKNKQQIDFDPQLRKGEMENSENISTNRLKKVLVLDLDETLIHTSEKCPENWDSTISVSII